MESGADIFPLCFSSQILSAPPIPSLASSDCQQARGWCFEGSGRPNRRRVARSLLMAAKRRRLVFLVGADEKLAQRVGAMGLHLPERAIWRARGVRRRHPNWLVTGSAHSPTALALAARCNLDAIFLSSIFPSRSPSAGPPIGPLASFPSSALDGGSPPRLGGRRRTDGLAAHRRTGSRLCSSGSVDVRRDQRPKRGANISSAA